MWLVNCEGVCSGATGVNETLNGIGTTERRYLIQPCRFSGPHGFGSPDLFAITIEDTYSYGARIAGIACDKRRVWKNIIGGCDVVPSCFCQFGGSAPVYAGCDFILSCRCDGGVGRNRLSSKGGGGEGENHSERERDGKDSFYDEVSFCSNVI